MIQEPTLKFVAIKMNRVGRQHYIASWPVRMILSFLGSLAVDSAHGSGLRLNHRKSRAMASQWAADGIFPIVSPLIVTIEKGVSFEQMEETVPPGFGLLSLPISKIIDLCDGVHRVAALKHLESTEGELLTSEWPVEFVECDDEVDAAKLSEATRSHAIPIGRWKSNSVKNRDTRS